MIRSLMVLGAVAQAATGGGPGSNPCAGRSHCAVAGPFAAAVTQFSSSRRGGKQVVHAVLTFTNVGDRPIVLAYKARSGSVSDEVGNRYANEGNDRHRVSGIGYATPNSADSLLVLGPGQSHSASFESWLSVYPGTKVGTVWSYDLTIDLLEFVPLQKPRTVQEFPMSFKGLTTTS